MKETPLSSSLIARVAEAARYVISGVTPATWFGPQQPMKPVAPADVAGRRFDYPVGYKMGTEPRSNEPVTFADLRALADNCDILRSVIETRKDQMEALEWTVRPREHAQAVSDEQKQRIDKVVAFLRYPDGEHSFAQWLRQVLEDMFVIDAVAIYKRRNRAGGIFALEVVDAASIRLLLDEHGRTPPAPDPAYQQVLKGVPVVDYSREELLYIKHNPRSHKVYGYSPVEQVLVTVNILIRRALHQLDYYREGSQPDALVGLPKDWNQDQLFAFQQHFDGLLAGNSAERRRVRFMPGDFKYQETKAPPLKDAYDEFLARIICFAFSASPEPFVGQVNRATAESSQARAIAEGLAPLQRFVCELMNRIIQRELGQADLEFIWQDTRQQDPREAAQIDVAYVGAGILTPDEVRKRMGIDALPKVKAEKIYKYNPYHDEKGRFTHSGGAVAPRGEEFPSIRPRSGADAVGVETANAARLIPAIAGAAAAIGAAGILMNAPKAPDISLQDAENENVRQEEEKKPDGEANSDTKTPINFEQPSNKPQKPKIPPDYTPDHQAEGGVIYRPPGNHVGSSDKAGTIRVMPPTKEYPDGYWRQYNKSGQPIDPSTGKTGTAGQTHTPLPSKE